MTALSPPHPDPCTLVLHGPEVFDSGDVPCLISRLNPDRVIVAGVMARTAAEESGIPCEFISLPPSRVIRDIPGCAILANHGKTADSGRIFGEIVASRLLPGGLIHLECADRTLYAWNRAVDQVVLRIAELTGFAVVGATVPGAGRPGGRRIRGCLEGEPVYLNGIVIGHATGPEVVLTISGGEVLPVSGIAPKAHGLEKVRGMEPEELSRAWCKSGRLRSGAPAPPVMRSRSGRVIFVDHCGHRIYQVLTPHVCGIVSVGDDTTAVCGHIGSHLGIPVFGIIDGDQDGIVEGRFAPGSVLAYAVDERDDDIGDGIRPMIPEENVEWEDFVDRLARHLGCRVVLSRQQE